MLVLKRYEGQKIRINDDITLVVVETRYDSARLGFEAPKEVAIDREEIYEAKQREREVMQSESPTTTMTLELDSDDLRDVMRAMRMREELIMPDGESNKPGALLAEINQGMIR